MLRRNLSCMATIIKRLFTFQDQQIVLGAGDLRLPSSATTVLDGSVAPGERGATTGFLILQSIVLRAQLRMLFGLKAAWAGREVNQL